MLNIQKYFTTSFLALLSLPATAMGFALSIQISTLSWKLDKLNLDAEQMGIVWSAGPIAGIIGQLLFGVISDKVWFWGGRRRPFIIIGGVLTALMILALANLEGINSFFDMFSLVFVAIVIALVLDLSINISFNPTRSVISDVTPEGEVRTKGYTWMQFVSGFFGVLAYFIGAVLGKTFLFYTGAVVVLAFTILPAFLIEEPRELSPSVDRKRDVLGKNFGTNWRQFSAICLAHSFTWLGVQTMFVYFLTFVKFKIDFPVSVEGIDPAGKVLDYAFMILNVIGFLLPVFVLSHLAKKIGRVKTHLICIAIMSLGYFGMVKFGNSEAMIYAMMAVVGIGWGATVSLPFAIMSESIDQSRMGFFMGVFNLSVVIPQLISSKLGGFIQESANKDIIFMISGVCLAISAVLWLLVKESANPSSSEIPVSGGGH